MWRFCVLIHSHHSHASDGRCCSKNKADLGLLPGLQDDSVGQKVLFFALGLIPVVAKREMSDWLSSNHTLLWGAFKISGRNVQIAVYWQRRGWCFMFSVIIKMFCTCVNHRGKSFHNSLHSCMRDFVLLTKACLFYNINFMSFVDFAIYSL